MQYSDKSGWRVPGPEMRTFGEIRGNYYRLDQPRIDYASILDRIGRHLGAALDITADQFKGRVASLLLRPARADLGTELQDHLLPGGQRSFTERFPGARFKAVLQGDSELAGRVGLDPRSRYQEFMDASEQGAVVGIYFLQGFDRASQSRQVQSLPDTAGMSICLSGSDICVALTANPELLFSEESYTPIPTMFA